MVRLVGPLDVTFDAANVFTLSSCTERDRLADLVQKYWSGSQNCYDLKRKNIREGSAIRKRPRSSNNINSVLEDVDFAGKLRAKNLMLLDQCRLVERHLGRGSAPEPALA